MMASAAAAAAGLSGPASGSLVASGAPAYILPSMLAPPALAFATTPVAAAAATQANRKRYADAAGMPAQHARLV